MRRTDFDMDDALSCAFVAETTGAGHSLVIRLARQGLIEVIEGEQSATGEPMLSRRSIMRLRRMQRLRRDLGVNFVGAAIILDLVERVDKLNRELDQVRTTENVERMSDEL